MSMYYRSSSVKRNYNSRLLPVITAVRSRNSQPSPAALFIHFTHDTHWIMLGVKAVLWSGGNMNFKDLVKLKTLKSQSACTAKFFHSRSLLA